MILPKRKIGPTVRTRRRWKLRSAQIALTDEEQALVGAIEPPKTRAECIGDGWNAMRPCPFVSSRYHLFLDVEKNGKITLNFPMGELGQLKDSCALDLAERDGMTLEECGELMNVTRERVRQIEAEALFHMRQKLEGGDLQ
jgi:hypothetical protein